MLQWSIEGKIGQNICFQPSAGAAFTPPTYKCDPGRDRLRGVKVSYQSWECVCVSLCEMTILEGCLVSSFLHSLSSLPSFLASTPPPASLYAIESVIAPPPSHREQMPAELKTNIRGASSRAAV